MEKLLANHLSQSTGKLFTEPPSVYFKRKAKNAHPRMHTKTFLKHTYKDDTI